MGQEQQVGTTALQRFKHLQGVFRQYQLDAEEELVDAQKKCKHPSVWEIPYKSFTYINSFPPYRMCCDCGYQENGWYCGYNLLDNPKVILRGDREVHTALSTLQAHMREARYEDGNREPFGEKVMRCLI